MSATAPPAAATHGRCEMHLVVQAPRLAATAVRHRDQSVPVAKWPTPGGTLPVMVDPRDPRDLRIRWDRVTPHGQARQPVTAEPATRRHDDELAVLAEATGVSGPVSPAPAGIAGPVTTSPATSSTDTLPAEPATPETDTVAEPTLTGSVVAGSGGDGAAVSPDGFGGSDDDPLDLSFLDPPRIHSLGDRDPLLVEYGSPIREVGVTLIVSDLKNSLEFYRDVLGFFEIESGPDMVLLEARTGRLVLRQREDTQAKPPRLMHLTLEVNDIDTAHRTLTKRGVEFIDEPRVVLRGEMLELWAVSFHDPDGHGVALTTWLPREEDADS